MNDIMKGIIAGVIGAVLTAGIFWFIGLIGVNVVLPAGAVVGFSGPCPAGWVNYDNANGKYILGADGPSGHIPYGSTGGKNSLTMKAIGEVAISGSGEAVNTPKLEDYNVNVGSGQRVELPIQPLYVALTMCQKP